MTDDEVIATLTAVKGIGVWTAEIYLMFSVGRADVLAAGKRGVLAGIIKGDVVVTPLEEITGRTRPADAGLLELARVMAI